MSPAVYLYVLLSCMAYPHVKHDICLPPKPTHQFETRAACQASISEIKRPAYGYCKAVQIK